MTDKTLFDKIIAGEIPSFIIWQDDNYAAFLTPFANTPGVTIVVPKQNPGEYVFDLADEAICGLMHASKRVAKLLEKALDVQRIALVFEGEAVPHVHAKLYPMHGFEQDRSSFPKQQLFLPQYPGYITTVEGPKMTDKELQDLQQRIQEISEATDED